MIGIKGRGGFRKTITPEIVLKIVCLTHGLLMSTEFKTRSRKKASYFTRKRKMPFDKLMLYMATSYNCSTQCGLRRFFFYHPQAITHETTISFGGTKEDKGLSLH
jgi:hypothetical protein